MDCCDSCLNVYVSLRIYDVLRLDIFLLSFFWLICKMKGAIRRFLHNSFRFWGNLFIFQALIHIQEDFLAILTILIARNLLFGYFQTSCASAHFESDFFVNAWFSFVGRFGPYSLWWNLKLFFSINLSLAFDAFDIRESLRWWVSKWLCLRLFLFFCPL